jgi:hypothetical protein
MVSLKTQLLRMLVCCSEAEIIATGGDSCSGCCPGSQVWQSSKVDQDQLSSCSRDGRSEDINDIRRSCGTLKQGCVVCLFSSIFCRCFFCRVYSSYLNARPQANAWTWVCLPLTPTA